MQVSKSFNNREKLYLPVACRNPDPEPDGREEARYRLGGALTV
jgi:hypothetical protein